MVACIQELCSRKLIHEFLVVQEFFVVVVVFLFDGIFVFVGRILVNLLLRILVVCLLRMETASISVSQQWEIP
jgi:hypothetical protein